MSITSYIWGLLFSTLLAFVAWVFVVFYINPTESGMVGKLFFYASFFLFIAGFLVTFFVWLRKKIAGDDTAVKTIGLSFRQGILLAIFFVTIVILFGAGYLIWWNALLILAGVFLIEFYFLSRDN